MKNKFSLRAIFVLPVVLAGTGFLLWPTLQEQNYEWAAARMTRAQIQTETAQLERQLIPTDDTPIKDVEAIYGKIQVNTATSVKGTGDIYHHVELLPASKRIGPEFRAMLFMRVDNGQVFGSGINHVCVVKGRRQLGLGLGRDTALQSEGGRNESAQLEREARQVLVDLWLIRARHSRALKIAPWNRQKFAPRNRNL